MGMDADERDIFQFLKNWGDVFTNAREVARRASTKQRFYQDPDWAKPILKRMEERGILESDMQGRYRIRPMSRKKQGQKWIAPNIAKILQEGGAAVEGGGAVEIADDEYYEQL